MAVPIIPTYSVAALVAAHTSFRDLLDAGAGAGSIKIRSSTDALLAQVPLTEPSGTVSGTTGLLTLTAAGRDEAADASGIAAYAEFCDSNGLVHLSLPTQAGGAAVSGFAVLNTLTIVAGGPAELVSATVG